MRALNLYAGNMYGGVERLLVTLAKSQHFCPEMQFDFGLCFEGRLASELREAGQAVHPLGNVRIGRPWTVWAARRRLARLLRRERYDVVVCHSFWPHAVFATVARAEKIPVVFWLHGETTGRHWMERWASKTPPDLVICVSKTTAETSRLVFPGVKTSVLHAPLSAPAVQYSSADREAARQELNTGSDDVVIIQVSRIEVCKGHDLQVEVAWPAPRRPAVGLVDGRGRATRVGDCA